MSSAFLRSVAAALDVVGTHAARQMCGIGHVCIKV